MEFFFGLVITFHGEGFARASLTVGENANIVSIDGRLDQLGNLIEDLLLFDAGSENSIEREFELGSAGAAAGRCVNRTFVERGISPHQFVHFHRPLVEHVEMRHFHRRHLIRRKDGANAAEDADVALQLLHRIVQLSPKRFFLAQSRLKKKKRKSCYYTKKKVDNCSE